MSTRMRVLGGVTIRRVVTTQGRATRLTGAQVHPLCADLHALLAFPSLRVLDARNRLDVGTRFLRHDPLLLLESAAADCGSTPLRSHSLHSANRLRPPTPQADADSVSVLKNASRSSLI